MYENMITIATKDFNDGTVGVKFGHREVISSDWDVGVCRISNGKIINIEQKNYKTKYGDFVHTILRGTDANEIDTDVSYYTPGGYWGTMIISWECREWCHPEDGYLENWEAEYYDAFSLWKILVDKGFKPYKGSTL